MTDTVYVQLQPTPALKRGVNPTTTFIRQKEGWISDRNIDTVGFNQSLRTQKEFKSKQQSCRSTICKLLSCQTTNFMGYHPLVVLCLLLADLHNFRLTKRFPKIHRAIQPIQMPSAFCINQIVPGFVVYYLNCTVIQLSSRGTPQKSKFLVTLGELCVGYIFCLICKYFFFA